MSLAVETVALSRSFGAYVAVRSLNLRVPNGAVFGFLGANGAGKTTTLKMILGLLKPSQGAAMVCGLDVVKSRAQAARRVGALLEAQGFYPELSAIQNLDMTRRLLDLPQNEVERVLEIVAMRRDAKRRVKEYSLGMRQRLGIARALIGSPSVLVLDEPANGLDPDGIADMRRFLRALPQLANTTVLVSSHLLSEVEQTATHLAIVAKGALVLQSEVQELLASRPSEVVLDTSDPQGTALLADKLGFDVVPDPNGPRYFLKKSADEVRSLCGALSAALVQSGISVFALAPRVPSLEEVYREAVARFEAREVTQ